jgi:hypothetical protein
MLGILKHFRDLRHLFLFQKPGNLLSLLGIFRREIDLIDLPFCEFFDRPEQQDDNHVFAHRRSRHTERRDLVQLIVRGVVGEDDELRFSRHSHFF